MYKKELHTGFFNVLPDLFRLQLIATIDEDLDEDKRSVLIAHLSKASEYAIEALGVLTEKTEEDYDNEDKKNDTGSC